MTLPLLSLMTFLPFSGIFFLALIHRSDEKNAKMVGLWISFVTFVLSLILWLSFDPFNFEYQFVEKHEWIKGYHIFYFLGIDGISLFLVLLTTMIFPLCLIFSWRTVKKGIREYIMLFLLLETFILGSFCSLDLVLFYIFFEGSLIPLFLIIGIWGGEERIQACFKFFLYTLFGSLLMLISIAKLYSECGTTDLTALIDQKFPFSLEAWTWIGFFVALAIKTPMLPFHTWLPQAHVQAPTAGSVILAAVLLKLGGYGFVRIVIPMLPEASQYFAPFVMTISITGIIYASLVTLVQKDMKKLIAYSSIAHMGFVTGGLFSLNLQGTSGAVLLMLSHGLVSSVLFLMVGMFYERFHSRDITAFGGLHQMLPIFSTLFLICIFASVGVPGSSSFVGEFFVLYGIFQTNTFLATLTLLGVILAPAYALWLHHRLFNGRLFIPPTASIEDLSSGEEHEAKSFNPQLKLSYKKINDLTILEKAVLYPLVILIFFIGVYPKAFTNIINRSVRSKVLITHPLSQD